MEESSEKEQKLLDNYIEHVHNKFNTWVIIIIPIIIVIIIISTISIPVITIQYTWQSLYLFTKQTFLPGTLMDSSSVSFLILSYRLDRYTPNLVISDWYLDFCLDHLHKNPNICIEDLGVSAFTQMTLSPRFSWLTHCLEASSMTMASIFSNTTGYNTSQRFFFINTIKGLFQSYIDQPRLPIEERHLNGTIYNPMCEVFPKGAKNHTF